MNYWSIENKNGDSTLLFNVSISGIIFMEFKKVASFQKDLNFYFYQTLITLIMQNSFQWIFNKFRNQNCVIQRFNFLFKTKFSLRMFNFGWRDKYK